MLVIAKRLSRDSEPWNWFSVFHRGTNTDYHQHLPATVRHVLLKLAQNLMCLRSLLPRPGTLAPSLSRNCPQGPESPTILGHLNSCTHFSMKNLQTVKVRYLLSFSSYSNSCDLEVYRGRFQT